MHSLNTHIHIAIDGYVGTWKGTTAKWVAQRLGIPYVDTWAMYRMLTLAAMRACIINDWMLTEWVDLGAFAREQKLSFVYSDDDQSTHAVLNWEDVEHLIRSVEIGMSMKPVVTNQEVRAEIVEQTRAMGQSQSLVADGRDSGTVVFPATPYKFFLVCDLNVRAQRRQQQLLEKTWKQEPLENILEEFRHRDETDYLWAQAVNKKADDALVIDTTHMSIEEQIEYVVSRCTE